MNVRFLNERFVPRSGSEIFDKNKFLDLFSRYSSNMKDAENAFSAAKRNLFRSTTDEEIRYIAGKDFLVVYGATKMPGMYNRTEVSVNILGYCFEKNMLKDWKIYSEDGLFYPSEYDYDTKKDFEIASARVKCYEKYLMNVSSGEQLLSVIKKFKDNSRAHWHDEGWRKTKKPI